MGQQQLLFPASLAAAVTAAPALDGLLGWGQRLPKLTQVVFGVVIAWLEIASPNPYNWLALGATLHDPPFSVGEECEAAKAPAYDSKALAQLSDIRGRCSRTTRGSR